MKQETWMKPARAIVARLFDARCAIVFRGARAEGIPCRYAFAGAPGAAVDDGYVAVSERGKVFLPTETAIDVGAVIELDSKAFYVTAARPYMTHTVAYVERKEHA